MNAPTTTNNLAPLREFVIAMGQLLDQHPTEEQLLPAGRALLARLVAQDHWLPAELAQPDAQYYRQYLLHADSTERFSVVSFVWGPGQFTPIHDHQVWGLIGMLRGAEISQAYRVGDGAPVATGAAVHLRPGDVEAVSPTIGDVHRVSNALADQVSISIHVYGGNIGRTRRHVFPADGGRKEFISVYNNHHLPNFWGASQP